VRRTLNASFDEIGDPVTQERQRPDGGVAGGIGGAAGRGMGGGRVVQQLRAGATRKGKRKRTVGTWKGKCQWSGNTTTVTNVRAVFFPLDGKLKLTRHAWSQGTIEGALRMGWRSPRMREPRRASRR